jgi:hypothetical protein
MNLLNSCSSHRNVVFFKVRLVFSRLNLDHFSVIRLATVIMSLSISVYLFTIKEKSAPTVLLHVERYYWQPYNVKNLVDPLFMAIGASMSVFSFLLFSHHFPRFRNEERAEYLTVFVLIVLADLVIVGLAFNNFIIRQRMQSRYQFNPVCSRTLATS